MSRSELSDGTADLRVNECNGDDRGEVIEWGYLYVTSYIFYACINMSKTALIIVDVQYDFLPPSGALAVPEGNQIIPRIKDLLSTGTKWRSVIATQVRPSTTCNA